MKVCPKCKGILQQKDENVFVCDSCGAKFKIKPKQPSKQEGSSEQGNLPRQAKTGTTEKPKKQENPEQSELRKKITRNTVDLSEGPKKPVVKKKPQVPSESQKDGLPDIEVPDKRVGKKPVPAPALEGDEDFPDEDAEKEKKPSKRSVATMASAVPPEKPKKEKLTKKERPKKSSSGGGNTISPIIILIPVAIILVLVVIGLLIFSKKGAKEEPETEAGTNTVYMEETTEQAEDYSGEAMPDSYAQDTEEYTLSQINDLFLNSLEEAGGLTTEAEGFSVTFMQKYDTSYFSMGTDSMGLFVIIRDGITYLDAKYSIETVEDEEIPEDVLYYEKDNMYHSIYMSSENDEEETRGLFADQFKDLEGDLITTVLATKTDIVDGVEYDIITGTYEEERNYTLGDGSDQDDLTHDVFIYVNKGTGRIDRVLRDDYNIYIGKLPNAEINEENPVPAYIKEYAKEVSGEQMGQSLSMSVLNLVFSLIATETPSEGVEDGTFNFDLSDPVSFSDMEFEGTEDVTDAAGKSRELEYRTTNGRKEYKATVVVYKDQHDITEGTVLSEDMLSYRTLLSDKDSIQGQYFDMEDVVGKTVTTNFLWDLVGEEDFR